MLNMDTLELTNFAVPGFRGVGEVSWGLDGLLYALDSGSPRPGVRVLNPNDFSLIREFELRNGDPFDGRLDARGIAVTISGQMFVADWDGRIYEFTPSGALVRSQPTGASNLLNIDLHPDGTLIVGGRFGDVVVTSTSLTSMFRFRQETI
jgi:hypothetical protein